MPCPRQWRALQAPNPAGTGKELGGVAARFPADVPVDNATSSQDVANENVQSIVALTGSRRIAGRNAARLACGDEPNEVISIAPHTTAPDEAVAGAGKLDADENFVP